MEESNEGDESNIKLMIKHLVKGEKMAQKKGCKQRAARIKEETETGSITESCEMH